MRKYIFTKVTLATTWTAHEGNDGGFILRWSADNGFGELAFFNKDGKTICDAEGLGKDFAQQALKFWLSTVEIKGD